MTPDIVKLREVMPTLEPIIDRLELQLVDDPAWGEPSDTSYLSDADRNNPDIAANVEAMATTNALISWFGKDAEGYLGLWRGPNERSLTEAPVVRLDSEGQYSIVAATVPEYLAIAMPEDEFGATRDRLTKAGFKVGFNPDAIWGAIDEFDDDPNAYRNELYEQARQARGLPRTDAEPEDEGDSDAVPEPRDFASGSMGAFPAQSTDDDHSNGASHDDGDDSGDDDEEEAAAPPPRAAAPARQPAANAAPKTAAPPPAKKPAAKAAAKAAPKKAAPPPAKKPAAKAAAKPAKKAPPPAKKPAAKAAAKVAAKKASKPAPKKPAGKPAKKKGK